MSTRMTGAKEQLDNNEINSNIYTRVLYLGSWEHINQIDTYNLLREVKIWTQYKNTAEFCKDVYWLFNFVIRS